MVTCNGADHGAPQIRLPLRLVLFRGGGEDGNQEATQLLLLSGQHPNGSEYQQPLRIL
jgi:hypothetical protein